MVDKTDERIKDFTQEELSEINKIPNLHVREASIEVGSLLKRLNNTNQYISVADFKKYIPLYSRELGKKYNEQRDPYALRRLAHEFYKKYRSDKPIFVVDNYTNKKILETLPPAAATGPTGLSLADLEKGRALDKAKRKSATLQRPDVVNEGDTEYYSSVMADRVNKQTAEYYASERVKTESTVKKLDEKRNAYYREMIARATGNKETKDQSTQSDVPMKLDIDEEDDF